MKIKHEHIREALNAWALYPGGRKTPVFAITEAYFSMGLRTLELFDDSHPNALSRNTQKIFRWVESDSPAAVEKIQILLPAIERAMPPLLLAKMRSYSSVTFRELVACKERIDNEVETLFGAMIALSDRMTGGGPAGNALIH
ncbi:TPA: Rha family transcriptional regulator [Klebsiella pneumoniae]|nr:Rha family transcriptional regulator [Klebsiella pneumoniae]HCB0080044.1 Rha family transcriptional regulator [Klebsiella pneumoniae]HEB5774744.1 Rha family transcriptional regulator [Klebsiella pneumoniae]HEB9057928.1 Rha family transcriptional regulator [Klebsiella pneumoniae]HEB9061855.1 Rha family transcriptional regulator [Klebsiella pneumoniae]